MKRSAQTKPCCEAFRASGHKPPCASSFEPITLETSAVRSIWHATPELFHLLTNQVPLSKGNEYRKWQTRTLNNYSIWQLWPRYEAKVSFKTTIKEKWQ